MTDAAVPREAAEDAPLPRLLETDEIINAATGPAVRAAIDRRIEQAVAHGHSRAADLARPMHDLVRRARVRLSDALDLLEGNPPPEKLARALMKVEIALGLALAGHDRISAELADRTGQQREEAA